jgi:ArsR family transcriptional regulator, arsenate/arsenite/antimonite-responsive transcriptional repressor
MDPKSAVTALAALAQETRLAVFRLLVEAGPAGVPVGTIGETLSVPGSTLSFHLKELGHAGLVVARQQGRSIIYTADFERMAALMSFLTQNCCRGMPDECLSVMEIALNQCCGPARKPRQSTRSRS